MRSCGHVWQSALAALLVSTARAGKAAEAEPLRVVHVGNSHSHALYLIEYLADAVGYKQTVGKINVLGASLRWNWDHPEQNKWPQVLDAKNRWDAITLLAWSGDDDNYAVKFATEAYKGNPDCEVLLYTIWPGGQEDWENPSPIRTEAHAEQVAEALEKAFPGKPKPRVIPSSLLMREIGRLADMGRFPGIPNRFALTSDGGHLSETGMYAIDVLVCAMLYRESPLEYPAVFGRKHASGALVEGWYDSLKINPETARAIREIACDILLTYPPAGMATQLAIADRSLPAALAGQPYEARLNALNVVQPAAWTMVKGTLPTGLSLSSAGAISGRTDQAGEFPVTVKLTDGKGAFERSLTLRVSRDEPPAIRDIALKSVALDEYCFQELKADGGVGVLRWDIAGGRLPSGIVLSPAGILTGTPGEAGEFAFTVRVTDTHPGEPRAAPRPCSWTIGPASPDTLRVRKAQVAKGAKESDMVRIDGALDESVWKLEQPVARKSAGSPSAAAAFDAFWVVDERGRSQSFCVAVRVKHGPGGKTPKDAVHLFLDGCHNREAMYNQDDLHVIIPREGKPSFPRSHTPWWFMRSAVKETDDGYTVEAGIGPAFFQGKGITTPFGAKAVYGFDVAVDEGGDAVSRQTWRGDATIDEDCRSFGSIWLVEECR